MRKVESCAAKLGLLESALFAAAAAVLLSMPVLSVSLSKSAQVTFGNLEFNLSSGFCSLSGRCPISILEGANERTCRLAQSLANSSTA
jgi:hypothetical protein